MEKNNQEFSMNDLAKIANSPAAHQLIAALQAKNSEALQQAAALANQGDFGSAQATLSSMLNSPDIQALLKQLGQ